MPGNLKIGTRLYLLTGFVLAISIVIGILGLIYLGSSKQRLASSLDAGKIINESAATARRAQLEFKEQVLEWKNILLWGKGEDSFEKYLSGLTREEAVVREELEKLKGLMDMSEVSNGAGDLAVTSRQVAANAEQTQVAATETAATVSEVASSISQVSQIAQEVAALSKEAFKEAVSGAQDVERITGQMEVIAGSSTETANVVGTLADVLNKVNQIVELITNISERTNLFALNAAIEAARAGEQGRGFAVVAVEVRMLAEQSASAAKDINQLIDQVVAGSNKAASAVNETNRQVNEGSAVVKEVGNRLKKIIGSIEELVDQIQGIAVVSVEISERIQNVASNTEEQTAAIEEVSVATEKINEMALVLDGRSGKKV